MGCVRFFLFRIPLRRVLLCSSLCTAFAGAAPGLAAELPMWSTIDNGGGPAAGGGFTLVGTIGQPDAGRLENQNFTLSGGYVGGGISATGVLDPDDTPLAPVAVFQFYPIAPNPFNPVTTIAFDLPTPTTVKLQVYDLRGQLVARILNRELPAGRHQAVWYGTDDAERAVASGVYVVNFEAGPNLVRRKITLVR